MNMRVPSFLLIAILIVDTSQIVKLDELSSRTLHQINRDPYIEVSSKSSDYMEEVSKQVFAVKVQARQKKQAYSKINQIYQKIIDILKKHQLISDEEFFVKSKIKTLFLARRRKWSFSLSFVIGGNQMELFNCYRSLSKLGIKKSNTYPSAIFSNQKVRVLDAYNNARNLLKRAMRAFTRMEITEVIRVEIQGLKSQNEVANEQYSLGNIVESYQQGVNPECVEIVQAVASEDKKNEIRMRVVFKIGQVGQQDSSFDSSEGESESSFENSEESQGFA